jgi:hypothetical protein
MRGSTEHTVGTLTQDFTVRWSNLTANELYTAQSVVRELCDLLGVDALYPMPKVLTIRFCAPAPTSGRCKRYPTGLVHHICGGQAFQAMVAPHLAPPARTGQAMAQAQHMACY